MKHWMNGVLIAGAIVCSAAVGFWFGHDTHADATTQPAESSGDEAAAAVVASVQTQPVLLGTIAQTVDAYGSVSAVAGSAVNMTLPFEARVEKLLVAVGTRVESGTPLIDVGPTSEAQLQFQLAEGALAAADRNLESVRARLNEQLATNADVDAAEQVERAAKTQLDSLKTRGVGGARQLMSDVAGVVSQLNVQVGQVAAAGTGLIAITPRGSVEATLGVEPATADGLKVGDSVELAGVHDADDATPAVGTVRFVNPQINPQTRLRDVSITLPPEYPLAQGAFVIGHLTTATAQGLVVPRSAVLPDDDDEVVFVVQGGKAQRRVVTIGLRSREYVQVTGDALHEGEDVIVTGNAELEDGMAVEVAPPATEPATEPATKIAAAPTSARSIATTAPSAEAK